MAETTKTKNLSAEAINPMIDQLWARTKDVYLAYLQARGTADAVVVSGMLCKMRAMALLACSIPAETMADLGPKTLFAALFREQLFEGSDYTLTMIECCLTADMRELQGVPLTEGL